MPIFLKVNHQLESRMPEIGQSGSEGGAKIAFVPTPILSESGDEYISHATMEILDTKWNVVFSTTSETKGTRLKTPGQD